jgi:hypothetical protein
MPPTQERYSIVKHIARGVLFQGYRPALMVMLSAYLDTSGNKRSQVMTMAAMLSSVGMWDNFKEEWPIFLKHYGVSNLHMTDFASSKREFKNWAGPQHSSRRKRFIDRAVSCVNRHTKRGFVSTMVIADFDFVNSRYEAEENYGPPLTICGMGVIGQVGRWAATKNIDPKNILYFIEDGDEDKGKFMAKARSYGFNVQPVAKAECCIFEACDMAAWKYSAGMRDAENKKGKFEDLVASLDLMARIVQHDVAVDRQKFLEHCISKGYPRRA